jgi:ABC-type amino acid transport substrate-binding protein
MAGLGVGSVLAMALMASPALAEPEAVTVCLDPRPPSATPASAASAPAQPPRSFAVELFESIFQRLGQPVRFVTDRPWARCLASVSRGQIDFALGGYWSAERDKVYAFSRSYQSLTPTLFSTAERPLHATRLEALKGLKGCGINGSSYEHYGLDASVLDLGVNSYVKLFDKLARGRCDYVPEELEVVASLGLQGPGAINDPALVAAPAPWARAPTKHLLAAKGSAAARLLPLIDKALGQAIQDGSAAELWRRYVPDRPYQP